MRFHNHIAAQWRKARLYIPDKLSMGKTDFEAICQLKTPFPNQNQTWKNNYRQKMIACVEIHCNHSTDFVSPT
jgi:hypothetical protein